MPAYGNPGPTEDMYSDAPTEQAPTPEAEGAEPEAEEEGEGKSYVLPKEILMGKEFKPGDELVVKIRAVHGDQIEVTYAPEKGGEGEYGAGEKAPMMPAGEMSSMME